MDIEKLIERLRYLAFTPSYTAFHDAKEREAICDLCDADFCYEKEQDAHWCMYEALYRAANALTDLWAENASLRKERDASVEDLRKHRKNKCDCCYYADKTSRFPCTDCQSPISTYGDGWKWCGPKED